MKSPIFPVSSIVRTFAGLSTAIGLATATSATPEAEPVGDEAVAEFIQMDLNADTRLQDARITLALRNGVATLQGTARTLDQTERAAARAMANENVRIVVNRIEIDQANITDSKLAEEVTRSLKGQELIDASRIRVTSDQSRITLTGEAGSWDEQELAREFASRTAGVAAIDNKLEVMFDTQRTDAQIEEQLRMLIADDPLYDSLSLSATVTDGVVKLSGQVGSKGEYDRLVRRVYVTGVFEVKPSKLEINHELKMEGLEDKHYTPEQAIAAIRAGYEADPRVDAESIQLDLTEGLLTLSGQVRDVIGRDAAESTARGVSGVLSISNQLQIAPQREWANHTAAN